MFKKIALLALLMIPAYAFAQESLKIGYFNSYEILAIMPEYAQMNDSLQKRAVAVEAELKIYADEYERKYTAYVEQQDTLVESIRKIRENEIRDLGQRIGNYQQVVQQQHAVLERELTGAIMEKLQNTVQQIGTDNKFTYIINAETLWFTSPQAIDVTPLVKQKLGLQ